MAKKQKDDFDFDKKTNGNSIDLDMKTIEKDIDNTLGEKAERQQKEGESSKLSHLSDRIRQGLEIKENLPSKGFLNFKAESVLIKYRDGTEKRAVMTTTSDTDGVDHIEVTNGLYQIDLRNDAEFWFIRSPTVVPQMITQTERAAIDRKDSYKPEKRKIPLPYWLIAGIAVGAIIIVAMLISMLT